MADDAGEGCWLCLRGVAAFGSDSNSNGNNGYSPPRRFGFPLARLGLRAVVLIHHRANARQGEIVLGQRDVT